jgi:hypothetical protein
MDVLSTAGHLNWILWIFCRMLHGILSFVSRRIMSLFLPASHVEYVGYSVAYLAVSYLDIRSCVSLWIFTTLRRKSHDQLLRYFVSRFTANYLDISNGVVGKLFRYSVDIESWVRRRIISMFCMTPIGEITLYFLDLSWWKFQTPCRIPNESITSKICRASPGEL